MPKPTNKAPTSITLSPTPTIVAENSASGTQVGILKVADPDKNDTITFQLSDSRFVLTSAPKGTFALKIAPDAVIDYETAQSGIQLSITATDSGGLSKTQQFTIQVTNVNEAPGTIALAPDSVTENQDGVVIGELSATDPEGNPVSYSVTDPLFEIVANTSGELRVLKLVDGQRLDYEATAEHTYALDITASDGTLSSTQNITIDIVNDIADDPTPPPTDGPINITASAPDDTFSASSLISGDGQSVAFYSIAQLSVDDTDSQIDAYLWTEAGGLTLLSDTAETSLYRPVGISDDGQTVVIADDQDGDLFIWNAESGLTLLTPGASAVGFAGMSADGTRVAMNASQLTEEDTDTEYDVYIWDATSGLSLLTEAAEFSWATAMSADGESVALYSGAALTEDDDDAGTDSAIDAYRWNSGSGFTLLTSGATERTFSADISADGQTITLHSDAALLAEDTDSLPDAYLWDAGTVSLLSPGSAGQTAPHDLSADGQTVTVSSADQLTADDTDGEVDAYLWTAADGLTLLAPVEGVSFPFAMSADGGTVAIQSSDPLTAEDTDNNDDVYVWTAGSGLTLLEAVPPEGFNEFATLHPSLNADGTAISLTVASGDGIATRSDIYRLPLDGSGGGDPGAGDPTFTLLTPSTDLFQDSRGLISADGKSLIVYSNHPLSDADTDGSYDVYAWNETDGYSLLTSGEENFRVLDISSDARSIAMISSVGSGSTEQHDAVLWTADGGQIVLTPGSSPTNTSTVATEVSEDGSRVTISSAERLTDADTDSARDAYMWTASDGLTLLTPSGNPDSLADARPAGMSADGQTLLIDAREQLTADDTDSSRDAYLWTADGITLLTQTAGESNPISISPDGQNALIRSYAPLTADEAHSDLDAYLWNSTTGFTLLSPGTGNGYSQPLFLTPDAQTVVLESTAQLTADDTDASQDVYLWSATDGLTRLTAGAGSSRAAAMSDDGTTVAIISLGQLTPDDTDSDEDAYLWKEDSGLTLLESPEESGFTRSRAAFVDLSVDGSEGTLTAQYLNDSGDWTLHSYFFQI